MIPTGEDEITLLLQRIGKGDRAAESRLLPIVYQQLHELAERRFRLERGCRTLEPGVLISELYLRIIRNTSIEWRNRSHFYIVAAETIRRILIDHARAANAQKRPKPTQRVPLEDVIVYSEDRAYEILMVDEALSKLKAWDQRQARIVELRFFGGLNNEQIAEILGVSGRTVEREWMMARAWLSALLGAPDGAAAH